MPSMLEKCHGYWKIQLPPPRFENRKATATGSVIITTNYSMGGPEMSLSRAFVYTPHHLLHATCLSKLFIAPTAFCDSWVARQVDSLHFRVAPPFTIKSIGVGTYLHPIGNVCLFNKEGPQTNRAETQSILTQTLPQKNSVGTRCRCFKVKGTTKGKILTKEQAI